MKNIDGIDIDQNIIATYYIQTPQSDLVEHANDLAVEQSTGTWTGVPAGESEICKKRTAKVTSVDKLPTNLSDTNPAVIQIAFPTENISPDFNSLLAAVAGNISMFSGDGWANRLLDLHFPKKWLGNFKGPKFGKEGVREYLDIQDRPILNNMIKPCCGISTETHVDLFREASFGGADIIKDDELLTDPQYNPFFERLPKCMEIVEKKEEETDEKTMYTINVTDSAKNLLEKAEKAVEMGANGLLLDSTVGLSGIRMLAEDPSIKVPIMIHPDFLGNIVSGETSGISECLYHKMERIAGADIIFTSEHRGKFPVVTKDKVLKNIGTITSPMKGIKPAIPFVTGGGLNPGHVFAYVRDYGNDIILGAGGGIHAHPMGPRAGGKAFRQAIKAAMEGTPPKEAAEKHEELKVALDKWGVIETKEEAKRFFGTQ